MSYEIPVFFGCVLASGFFSGSETALIGADHLKLRRLAEEGDGRAGHALELVTHPRRLLAGILVGNNVVNILAAVVAGAYFARLYQSPGIAALMATLVTTPIIVLFAEYLPKTLAALQPIRFARTVVQPLRTALVALTPLVWPLEMLSRPIGALLTRKGEPFALADVRGAVAEGIRTGAVGGTLARVLRGGLSLEWKTVADILVPRVDVASVAAEASAAECAEAFRTEGYSRLLVQGDSLDADQGYVAAKDLARLDDEERRVWTAGSGARDTLRVPASLPIERLLLSMRRSGVHFAVVKDEYGGTEGIVTLEDVLEEVVGEIRDEHDIEEVPPLRRLRMNVWLVRGDVSVRDVTERLGVSLQASDARTMGGYVAEVLGRVPHRADVVEGEGVKLIVRRVKDNRVLLLRVITDPS